MNRPRESRSASYFEDIYERDPDPWRFATSDYERAKYEATLAALGRGHYARALEIGCSIGVFTRMLAPRCGSLLAIDVADSALVQARQRCADCPQVEFRRMQLPDEVPAGSFDLVVISEVLYYLTRVDVERTASFVAGALAAGGEAVLVHWTGPHLLPQPLLGDEAAEAFIAAASRLSVVRQERAPQYRLDLLRRD